MADLSSILAGTDEFQTPEEVERRRRQGTALFNRGTSTEPVQHWAQALARGVQGGIGGYEVGQARDQEARGKGAANSALIDAMVGKKSPNDIAATALRNPWSQDFGQKLAGSSIQSQIQQNSPEARLAREKAEFDLQSAREQKPLQTQVLQAQVDAAKQKSDLDKAMMGMVFGEQQPLPGAKPAQGQPGFKPMSGEIAPADPNLIQAQATQSAPLQPAQEVPKNARDIIRGRSPAEQTAFIMAYRRDPAEAAKMLQLWASPGQMGKAARNAVDEKEINTTEYVARLNGIAGKFDPKFQTIENRLGYKWSEWMDSFKAGQKTITPEQRQELASFSRFKQESLANMNQYIKEITGAAMTDAEAKRIIAALPNPGQGVFDGDSPTVFHAKLQNATTNAKMAIARYRHLRNQGFSGSPEEAGISLEQMPKIIDQRGAVIEQKLKQQYPQMDPKAIQIETQAALAKEFGFAI